MTIEQAWKELHKRSRDTDRKIVWILISFLFIITGTIIIVTSAYAGIPIICVGAASLVIAARKGNRGGLSATEIYEKYILTPWISEYFSDVKFTSGNSFSRKQLEDKEFFPFEWEEVYYNRCFTATYKGHALRMGEMVGYIKDAATFYGRHKEWLTPEEEYTFYGRFMDIETEPEDNIKELAESVFKEKKEFEDGTVYTCFRDGHLYIFHNLYKDEGAFPIWLPAPVTGNSNISDNKEQVDKMIVPYVDLCSKIVGVY